ncbi:hypothetical protein XBKQ1_2310006 [Xenorhabdus bovienii str. kraussei Quebec]|uniref:Uncharacterized protein n=1 Tax=Xenorhabdus bovienii str. kraussei Quebec TaxID=1398203 RepID=A0A077PGF4_XENBV|nr:hypothetical protein XBKQ1_2310006 [Xenorhabdus bovienii str. kraussei Quebec]
MSLLVNVFNYIIFSCVVFFIFYIVSVLIITINRVILGVIR